ncbi:hypothetical protein AB0I48_35040 [Nocardia aurea]|uniref:Uncharacterized protein n=1 Tax=Nocardia aurea TaxID=2144174 RepID=A0ABV3G565_9NOCA
MARQRAWIRRKASQTRLWAWMPYEGGSNRDWILGELGRRIRPEWNKTERRWEIARKHLWVLTEAMADRFGEVELYLEFSKTELCDSRCQNAQSTDVSECVCSCLGDYHGGRGARRDWKLSGATTLVSNGPFQERYMLIRRTEPVTENDRPPSEHPLPEQPPEVSTIPTAPDPPSPTPAIVGATDRPRQVAPTARPTGPPAREELPLGCGVSMLLTAVAIPAILAIAVHGLFWIGVALVLFIAVLVGAEL